MYPKEFYVNFNIGKGTKKGNECSPVEFENVILFFFPFENHWLDSQSCLAQMIDNTLFAR